MIEEQEESERRRMEIPQMDAVDELKKVSDTPQSFVKSDRFDLTGEIRMLMEDQNDEEGYTVDKELLINAWCKFRPMGEEEGKNSSTGDETKRMMDSQRSIKKKTQLTDVNKIFGDLLVFDILRNFHLKLYNFSETDAEQTQR